MRSTEKVRLEYLPEDSVVVASRNAQHTKVRFCDWQRDALSVLRHLERPVLHGITVDEFVGFLVREVGHEDRERLELVARGFFNRLVNLGLLQCEGVGEEGVFAYDGQFRFTELGQRVMRRSAPPPPPIPGSGLFD